MSAFADLSSYLSLLDVLRPPIPPESPRMVVFQSPEGSFIHHRSSIVDPWVEEPIFLCFLSATLRIHFPLGRPSDSAERKQSGGGWRPRGLSPTEVCVGVEAEGARHQASSVRCRPEFGSSFRYSSVCRSFFIFFIHLQTCANLSLKLQAYRRE